MESIIVSFPTFFLNENKYVNDILNLQYVECRKCSIYFIYFYFLSLMNIYMWHLICTMYCPVHFVIISYLILTNVVTITETIVFLFIKC